MKNYVIIVAGGSGSRMKSDLPKQFLLLNNKPILFHTMEAFQKALPELEIILVMSKAWIDYWNQLKEEYNFNTPHLLTPGGKERYHSVKNGLFLINDDDQGIVGVHDAARPLISTHLIKRCFDAAIDSNNAIPALPSSNSIRIGNATTNKAIDRSEVNIIQTPQCFKIEQLKEAYKGDFKSIYTDDASVVEIQGIDTIKLVEGESSNIKITEPLDLIIAEQLLNRP